MHQTVEPARSGSHSVRLLKELAEEGLNVFTTSEAKQIAVRSGIPEGYVTNLLMIMVRDGWLKRLRRGMYIRSGPALGDIQIHSFAIATHLVVPSAISHWSALHYHGLTEQVPRVVTAFTPKKVVTPSMRRGHRFNNGKKHAWVINGVRYEYITVKRENFFGIEKIWVDEFSRVPITNCERTVLELFISPRMFGGMGEALGIIENHLPSLAVDKLVEYACRYGKISVAKRLGWVLEQAGASEAVLEPLLKIQALGYHVLDPTRPRRGSCDKRWMIQVNI
ncbi:MAG: type IV toxin-antitoxin system AbiEi family antitoxin domain-containing protein [Thermovirga sp.]|nr:type IV toxin-antitoxin system AbiEi family antitoxin domain-containing protein [Thermovirga sp.]